MALGAALLVVTAPVAWAGLKESRAHGGIPGWKTFNPDLRQSVFARDVNRATHPEDVLFFHTSFANPPPYRMDRAFYYDRDLSRGALLRVLQGLPPAQQRRAVVLLVPSGLSGDERRAYAELARQHPLRLVDDLAMLDLRTAGPDPHAYVTAPDPAASGRGTFGRWLRRPLSLAAPGGGSATSGGRAADDGSGGGGARRAGGDGPRRRASRRTPEGGVGTCSQRDDPNRQAPATSLGANRTKPTGQVRIRRRGIPRFWRLPMASFDYTDEQQALIETAAISRERRSFPWRAQLDETGTFPHEICRRPASSA